MKQLYTCLLFLCSVLSGAPVFAAAPTVPSSAYTYNAAEGNRIAFSFKAGNGTRRIIVAKEGSAVTGIPVNGTTYSSNAAFGTAGTAFTAAGEFVVMDGGSSNLTITNLTPGTTYHFAIFEYNGTGATIEYLNIAAAGNYFTVATPTIQASAINISAITGNAARIDFTKGDGAKRLVVLRKDNPVTGTPTDFTYYVENPAFGNGSLIGAGNYVVYANTGTGVSISNLEPNTIYHISIFEYNGATLPLYLKPAATASFTSAAGPNIAPTNLTFSSIDGDRHIITYKEGNGTKRLVIARKGAAVTAIPQNGVAYTANTIFGSGTEIKPGEFVINNAYNTSFTVTNLEPNTIYYYAVFEFDGTGTNTYYLTSSYLQGSGSTAITPTTSPSAVTASNIKGSTVDLSCVAGNGTYRLFVMKEGAPVDISPVDLKFYTVSAAFGTPASLILNGNYALSTWSNNTLSVTGLKAGVTYHVAVFEYNGMYHPVYQGVAARGSFTTVSEPTTTGSGMNLYSVETISAALMWTPGNGTKRILVAKKGSAVTSRPQDGTFYTANKVFGSGTALGTDEFVMLDGTGSYADLTNLEPNTTYHVAVFEYNVTGAGLPDYLTSSFLTYNFTTLKRPTLSSSALNVTGITNTQATVNLTIGNGYYRLGVVREQTTAEVTPDDLKVYPTGPVGGTSITGPGNYVSFKGTGNSGLITGLQPGTTYTATVYEFNGSASPLYLIPGSSVTFTTTGTPPLLTPTQAGTAPSVVSTEGNTATLNFTAGNGNRRIIVMKEGAAATFTPADGSSYTFNSEFGKGVSVKTGEFIVFNGSGNSAPVTGLKPNTVYYASVFEYNTDGTGYKYLTTSFLSTTMSTVAAPVSGATDLKTAVTDNSITLTITRGSGLNRLIAVREGSAISASPVDLSLYPANATMGGGSQLEAGSFVVYTGSNNTVTITGLASGKQYHVSVFEYNGNLAPVYNKTNVLNGFATTSGSLPVTWQYVNAMVKPNGILLNWATAQELNTARFEIERSDDGVHYYKRATIAAAGESNTPRYYNWLDQQPQSGSYQYRIKQVDIDDKFSYSKIIHIRYNPSTATPNAVVYPNPARSEVSINWPGNEQQAMLTITDASGIRAVSRQVNNGETISLSAMHAGIWYLQILTKTQQYTLPLIKY
ncbi:MAG: T9SS type A sorting domain-containing protein [Chitinophagaceae bacterium]|nr:T9SS type A sorting domain-containing protein [Chitinophagaceae bacterium]